MVSNVLKLWYILLGVSVVVVYEILVYGIDVVVLFDFLLNDGKLIFSVFSL